MRYQLSTGQQIEVLLRAASHPYRLYGPCIIRLIPRADSRVVALGADTVRVAFVPAEVQILAETMKRTYPRLRFELPSLQPDCNRAYAPGGCDRPFVAAFAARDAGVRIGTEFADATEHPVVELTARPKSRVCRSGQSIEWMPSWTEFRATLAEFELASLRAQFTAAEESLGG